MQLHIGKVRARARALTPEAAAVGPSDTQWVHANTVVTDDAGIYPGTGTNPTGAAFVGVASQWAMLADWQPGLWELPGLAPDPQRNLAPAPGSQNLVQARDTGGVPGTQRIARSVGPVVGPTAVWTGNQSVLPVAPVGSAGPVGRADYSAQLTAAWAAANRQVLDQALIEAQLVAAQ